MALEEYSWRALIVRLSDLEPLRLNGEGNAWIIILVSTLILAALIVRRLHKNKLLKIQAQNPPHRLSNGSTVEDLLETVELYQTVTDELLQERRKSSTSTSKQSSTPAGGKATAQPRRPAKVNAKATKSNRSIPDCVVEFFSAQIVRRPGNDIRPADLYRAYAEWCPGVPVSENKLFRAATATFEKRETRTGNFYCNIGIRGDRSGIGAVK